MKTYPEINLPVKFSNNTEVGFIKYTCTNHPEVIVNEPGKCPQCGKDLVKKY